MARWKPWKLTQHAEDVGLEPYDTVERLVEDPADVPELFVMQGWIGQSRRPNVWRVYQDHALSEYYEIHEDHIAYTEFIDAYAGVKRVWVRRGSPMRHVVQNQQPAEVDYLSGAFADQAKKFADVSALYQGLGGPEPRSGCPGCGSKSP